MTIKKEMSFLVLLFFLLVFMNNSYAQSVSLNSMLEEMMDRYQLSYFPEVQYELKQLSSYNRRSQTPDSSGWYANNDMSHFLRVETNNGRREFVMFAAEGPGAIVRWWMTFYKAQNGIIRIYLDYDSIPVIEGSPAEVLSGNMLVEYPFSASVHKGAPLGEEGRDYDHNLYLPIPYSKHGKITYECDSLILKYSYGAIPVKDGYYWPDVFYNICYRKFPQDTHVESFSKVTLTQAKPLIEKVKNALLDEQFKSDTVSGFQQNIQPGDSLIIEFSRKESAIDRLSLDLLADDVEQALRSTVIAATFDGIQTIWVPVGEFFGMGYIPVSHKTWINQRQDDGLMESRWVMPYQENCQIIFINFGTEEIRIKGSAGLTKYNWKPSSMYFGAAWHEYRHIKTRNEQGSKFDINFINIDGKGVYVGDQVTLYNNTYHWWGEGDEKIFVDGEPFPSSFGTGTEDYYGYAFGRPEPFSHPFLSQPIGAGNTNWGLTVNMRHRSLDAIPFTSSIKADIEMWHWASIVMNYALTSYWYVEYPFNINIEPDINAVQYPVIKSKEDFNAK
jgi:hypothetical protein